MGRTKRLRQKKRNGNMSINYSATISLHKYLGQFGWKNTTSLICKNYEFTGRGLCSKHSLSQGDLLIKLPFEAMITIGNLENDKLFRCAMEGCALPEKSISFQGLLALYVLYRKHLIYDNSKFDLYINSLPETFSMPYFCRSDELYFLPEVILQQTVGQNKKIRQIYNTLEKAFLNKTCNCCGQSYMTHIFTLSDFKWAYFVVNSRSVFLDVNAIRHLISDDSPYSRILADSPTMALAPFLDMFNHSDKTEVRPQVIRESNVLYYQIITRDSYKPYEQLFINYGNLTNVKLLVDYGFCIENNASDYFEISLADIEALIMNDTNLKSLSFHSNKFKFIRDHNLNDQMFIHAHDGLSHNLQVTLYLIFKESSHYTNALNQTAFGSCVEFENSIQNESRLLILSKINEYENYIKGFSKLKNVSLSAKEVMRFLKHSLCYLQLCLNTLN